MPYELFILSRRIRNGISLLFNNHTDNVLDIGCGDNPKYHKYIKGKIISFDIRKTRTTHVVGDADKLDSYFKAESFDKVISINSLYYFKNPFRVVEHVHKLLKKGEIFVLVVPFFYPIHDAPEDRYRFTEHGLRAMLEPYFKVEKIKTIGGIFNLPAVILHSLIKGIPLLFPKRIRKPARILIAVLYPFYLMAQIFGFLDIFDRTKRFPIYYFVVARKK